MPQNKPGLFKTEIRCVLCEVTAETEETVDHRASNERRDTYFRNVIDCKSPHL